MWGKTSFAEKLLCLPVVGIIFMVDTDDMFAVWIAGACIVAIISTIFKLGVDDK